MSRMPCPDCGSYNEENALFCDQCGRTLKGSTVPQRRNTGLFLLSGVLIVLLGGFAVFLAVSRKNRGEETARNDPAFVSTEKSDARDTQQAGNPARKNPRFGGTSGNGSGTGTNGEIYPTLSGSNEADAVSNSRLPVSTSETGKAKWAQVRALDGKGRNTYSGFGAVLEEALLLCPVGVLVNAEQIQVQWGQSTFTCRETAGWDLDRGLCLLALPAAGEGFAADFPKEGGEAEFYAGGARNQKITCTFVDPALYGADQLPCLGVDKEKTGGVPGFFLTGDMLVGISWYSTPFFPVALCGTLSADSIAGGGAFPLLRWNREIWQGSSYDLFTRGKKAFLANRLEEATGFLTKACTANNALWPVAAALTADAYIQWAQQKSIKGEIRLACEILREALTYLPESKEILLFLSKEEAASGQLEEALVHMREALRLDQDLWDRHWPLLEKQYLQFAATLGENEAIELLYRGLEELPQSVDLRIKLGELLFTARSYREAIAVWEEAYELSPDAELAALIVKAKRIANASDEIVVIPFSVGTTTVRTDVSFERRVEARCIVDTGASYTALPHWAAGELGISENDQRMVKIATASGVREVPVVTLNAVGLGHLEVGPIEVLILDLPHGPGEKAMGLLGMNFLRHFHVTMDRDRKEIRVSEK